MANEFKKFAKKFNTAFIKDAKAAGVFSINRGILAAKTQAIKDVSNATGGQQKQLRNRIGQFKATAARPSGAVIAFAKPLSLSAFGPRAKVVKTAKGKRTGVTVTGPEGRYLVPGGFMLNARSGISAVFARVGAARNPIKKLFTNELIKYLAKPEVIKALELKAKSTFEANFIRELKRRYSNLK